MSEEEREAGVRDEKWPSCHWHPRRRAIALCVSCGRAVCDECDRRSGYRHYCSQCLPEVPHGEGREDGQGGSPPPQKLHLPSRSATPLLPRPPASGETFPAAGYPPLPLPPGYPQPPGVGWGLPRPAASAWEPLEPEDRREHRWWRADWKLSEVAVLLLVIFGAYNLLGIVLFLTTENPLLYEYLAYALFFCPLILGSTAWLLKRHRRGREELGLVWVTPWKTLLSGVGGGMVALALSYAAFLTLYFLFYILAGRPPAVGETEQLLGTRGVELALVLLVAVLLAPVFEEIFFRGLFYSALRRKMGPRAAVLLNGLIFGALHFQPLYMVSLVLVGMVLAFLYERTDSLFASMTAHALYNLVVILVALRVAW